VCTLGALLALWLQGHRPSGRGRACLPRFMGTLWHTSKTNTACAWCVPPEQSGFASVAELFVGRQGTELVGHGIWTKSLQALWKKGMCNGSMANGRGSEHAACSY
jgi:hypothetical protein